MTVLCSNLVNSKVDDVHGSLNLVHALVLPPRESGRCESCCNKLNYWRRSLPNVSFYSAERSADPLQIWSEGVLQTQVWAQCCES